MTDKTLMWSLAMLLVLACVAAYVNTLDGQWVWDDVSSVLLHRHVQQPAKFFQLFREDQHAFGRGQGNFYRPLVAASFMLDYALSGGPHPDAYPERTLPEVSPLLFHITNMLWHLGAALLFLILLKQLGAPRFALAAAPAVFVVHPLHTEAVAYISGRADMMSAVAILAALNLVLAGARRNLPALGVIGAGCCFIGGLLSKESTLIYPVLLALMWPLLPASAPSPTLEGRSYKRFMPLLSAGGILLAYLALRTTVLRFAEGAAAPAAPLAQRLVETITAFGVYLRLLFVPTGLHMERSLDGVSMVYAVVGLVMLLVLLGAAVASWRQGQRRIAVGIGWFLAAWLPISGVFPLNAPLAEHWMYVPMIGFWWALAECLHLLTAQRATPRRAAYVATAALCCVFVVMTAHRNRDWHDNVRLFTATLAQNPNTTRVQYNLAVTYETEGNLAGARRHYEAFLDIRARMRAEQADPARVAILDDEIETRLSLGRILMQLTEYAAAVNTLAPLAQLAEYEGWRPTAAFAAMKTGQALIALGEVTQANAYLEQALRIEPGLAMDVEQILAGAPFYEGY